MVVQSWFVVGPSSTVKAGRPITRTFLGRPITFYRDHEGAAHALDAHCPHMGADLRHGRVVGQGIQCAFHGWTWDAAGRCVEAPGCIETPSRRTRAYPLAERWGLLWLFNGPRPSFELPDVIDARIVRLPPQRIDTHPHVVMANALDTSHLSPLHGIELLSPTLLRVDGPLRLDVQLHARFQKGSPARILPPLRRPFLARFSILGAHLTLLTVEEPIRFQVLFTGRPEPDGSCTTNTLFFIPHGSIKTFLQAHAILVFITQGNRRIMDGLRFRRGFAEHETGLITFAELVDQMETW